MNNIESHQVDFHPFIYNEYEYSEIFGGHPNTQPLFRLLSKTTYKTSMKLFPHLQCNYSISKKEVISFLETKPQLFSIFILTNGPPIYELKCYKMDHTETKKYTAYIGPYLYGPGESIFNYIISFSIYELNIDLNILLDIENMYNNDNFDLSSNSSTKVFFDSLTTKSILSRRLSCVNVIKDYSQKKTLEIHNQIVKLLSDDPHIPLLNLYLGISTEILNGTNVFKGYLSYTADSQKELNNIVIDYNKETFEHRQQLLEFIKYTLLDI